MVTVFDEHTNTIMAEKAAGFHEADPVNFT
jgi:hypothetical protein